MKHLFYTFLLLLPLITEAQRNVRGSTGLIMPRDKVKLKNGDSETGRVIACDSGMIRLRKYDYSEKKILWSEIDTVTGLSWFTYFISPSLGTGQWNRMVNNRLDTFNTGISMLSVKLGTMRKKRWAIWLHLNYQAGGPDFALLHAGGGIRCYFPLDYVRKSSTYFGFMYGYNVPSVNIARFFNTGFELGYEHRIKGRHRFFIEYNHMRTSKFDPAPTGYAFALGMRFSMEYSDRYYRINNRLPLAGGRMLKEEKKIRTEF